MHGSFFDLLKAPTCDIKKFRRKAQRGFFIEKRICAGYNRCIKSRENEGKNGWN